MKGCDLSEANFEQSILDSCNLEIAQFDQTNLKNADLSTAYNFELDPDKNQLKGAKFSNEGVKGLLKKFGIQIV